jgi:anaerobic magnesium-protoporphyrin IX monomethyl ester cyclase
MNKKLNYLLVMPRLIQDIGDGYSFTLGIVYISSSMKKAGYNVTAINLNHHQGAVDEIIKREIESNKIDVLATGGLSYQYNTVKSVIAAAKLAKSGIITIVGGGIISGDAEPAMRALEYADYGVIGEGEVTINELCRALECGEDVSKINGIIYKTDHAYKITMPRKELENIDVIPWPDYQGFEIDKYLRSLPPGISGLNRRNTVFMLASRSCPYNCTFCFHTAGRKYRQRSLDDFFAELDHLVSKYNIEFICLADELFARDIKRVKEFCARIKHYNIRWWAQFRVDDITPELLAILKDGRCEVMSFGLESADNRVLKSMRKGTTVEQIERTLKLVYDSGISIEGAFIFGDIAETVETANNTLKWWREHSEYRITLNLITVYPGSFLYKYACEKNIIKDKVKFLRDGCPQINVSKLTDRELSELIKHFMDAPISLTKRLVSASLKGIDYKTGRIGINAGRRAVGTI